MAPTNTKPKLRIGAIVQLATDGAERTKFIYGRVTVCTPSGDAYVVGSIGHEWFVSRDEIKRVIT